MGPSIADSAEWTAGESNPDLRRAMPVSSRWTSSPFEERNRPEPSRFPRLKVRPRIELGPPPYQGGVLPEHLQTGFLGVVPAGLEPAYPVCKTGVFAARRRDELRSVARVGVEPTGTRLSDLAAMPVSVPCRANAGSCGSGSRTSASERMKLGRAPAHPQSQAPVSSRADRPYEGQPGTCLAWENRITDRSVAGGRFELPRLGGTCV